MRSSAPLNPFKAPIRDIDDENDDDDWYYGANSGGIILWFGMYKDYKLHQVPLHYVEWCRKNLTSSIRLQRAILPYFEGVTTFTIDHYGDFIVPLGVKHKGQTIAQCRDKPWFEWLTQQWDIRDRYPHFIHAVYQWLANPRHQGLKRDIGELLESTKYKDDLELSRSSELDEEELTQEDIDFLDDSSLVDGTEDTGSEPFDIERVANLGANLRFRVEEDWVRIEPNEADISQKSIIPASSNLTEKAGKSHVTPHKRLRTWRSDLSTSKTVSPPPRRIRKHKYVKGAEYSDSSSDIDEMSSFIDDGPIRGEDADTSMESETSSGSLVPFEGTKQRKSTTRPVYLKREKKSHARTKIPHNHQVAVNAVFDSDNSDPPEVHVIFTPSKSQTRKRLHKGEEITRTPKDSQGNSRSRLVSHTLRSTTNQSANAKKNQYDFLPDPDDASDSTMPFSFEIPGSTTTEKPRAKVFKSGGASQMNKGARRGLRKRPEAIRPGGSSTPVPSDESPRASRRRLRNAKNRRNADVFSSSYRSNNNSDEDTGNSTQEEESNNGRNEIDDISSEVSAEFSIDKEDFSEDSRSRVARQLSHPSPPLTVKVRKWQKQARPKRRSRDTEGFIVSDEETANESDDFRATSTTQTSTRPNTPEPDIGPRYSTRTSSRKASSPEKLNTQLQTPNHRCYVELSPLRSRSAQKRISSPMNSGAAVPRSSPLKRSRKIILSSDDECNDETKRPRLSPLRLPHPIKSKVPQSDEETVDGSVDGETVMRGSSLGLSRPSSFNTSPKLRTQENV